MSKGTDQSAHMRSGLTTSDETEISKFICPLNDMHSMY